MRSNLRFNTFFSALKVWPFFTWLTFILTNIKLADLLFGHNSVWQLLNLFYNRFLIKLKVHRFCLLKLSPFLPYCQRIFTWLCCTAWTVLTKSSCSAVSTDFQVGVNKLEPRDAWFVHVWIKEYPVVTWKISKALSSVFFHCRLSHRLGGTAGPQSILLDLLTRSSGVICQKKNKKPNGVKTRWDIIKHPECSPSLNKHTQSLMENLSYDKQLRTWFYYEGKW